MDGTNAIFLFFRSFTDTRSVMLYHYRLQPYLKDSSGLSLESTQGGLLVPFESQLRPKIVRSLSFNFPARWWRKGLEAYDKCENMLTGTEVVFGHRHHFQGAYRPLICFSVSLEQTAFVTHFEKGFSTLVSFSSKLFPFHSTGFLGLGLCDEGHCRCDLQAQFQARWVDNRVAPFA